MYKETLTVPQKIRRECRRGWERAGLNVGYFLRTRGRGFRCEDPVLITGCGHTGTTWLLRVLAAHPDLHAVNFESSFARWSDRRERKMLARFNKETVCRGKKRWVEKTPKHVRHLDRIFRLFPAARVVVMVRDPRDVVSSLKKRSGDFEEALERWVGDNTHAEEWRDDPRVHFVCYEDLKEGFEDALRVVVDFLGLPWSDRLLDYTSTQFRFLQDLKPVAPSSGGDSTGHRAHLENRKRQIEQKDYDGRGRWRNDLEESELDRILAHGDLIRNQGYGDILE